MKFVTNFFGKIFLFDNNMFKFVTQNNIIYFSLFIEGMDVGSEKYQLFSL